MKNWLRKTGAALLLLVVFSQSAGVLSVSGQAEARIKINKLDASHFPTIRLEADVYKPDGSFVSDLTSSDFKVMENGIMRPVDEVQETPNAVDFHRGNQRRTYSGQPSFQQNKPSIDQRRR